MPPSKRFDSYIPQTPCTTLERLSLSLIAKQKNTTPAQIIRWALQEYIRHHFVYLSIKGEMSPSHQALYDYFHQEKSTDEQQNPT